MDMKRLGVGQRVVITLAVTVALTVVVTAVGGSLTSTSTTTTSTSTSTTSTSTSTTSTTPTTSIVATNDYWVQVVKHDDCMKKIRAASTATVSRDTRRKLSVTIATVPADQIATVPADQSVKVTLSGVEDACQGHSSFCVSTMPKKVEKSNESIDKWNDPVPVPPSEMRTPLDDPALLDFNGDQLTLFATETLKYNLDISTAHDC